MVCGFLGEKGVLGVGVRGVQRYARGLDNAVACIFGKDRVQGGQGLHCVHSRALCYALGCIVCTDGGYGTELCGECVQTGGGADSVF